MKEFRPLRRFKQAVSEEECLSLLQSAPRGILSVMGENGYPYGVPMNFVYREGKIYFHCAREGHKIDAIKRCDKASFCVYDRGFRRAGEWALNIRSVIVFGRIEFIEDRDTVCRIAAALSRKFTDDEDYIRREIDRSGPGTLMFALVPEHVAGKLVNES